MPLVRISIIKRKSDAYIRSIADGVHKALVETFDVPLNDRFQIIQQHERNELIYDTEFLGIHRTADVVFINIVASKTRDTQTKQALYKAIAENLTNDPGLRPEDILVTLSPNDRDDWSFGKGLASYVKSSEPILRPQTSAPSSPSQCPHFAMLVCALALVLGSATLSFAQNRNTPPQIPLPTTTSQASWPKADPTDVDTIEDTVRAFYSAISTPAGGKLDRNRLRSLFVPEGRIAAGRPPTASHPADAIILTLDEYASHSDAQTVADGFFDKNLANQVEQFGVMAHVYSAYESRNHLDDAKPMARGIKSFELLHGANRWYIIQVYWDRERPDNPIPELYLHDNLK